MSRHQADASSHLEFVEGPTVKVTLDVPATGDKARLLIYNIQETSQLLPYRRPLLARVVTQWMLFPPRLSLTSQPLALLSRYNFDHRPLNLLQQTLPLFLSHRHHSTYLWSPPNSAYPKSVYPQAAANPDAILT